MGRRSDYNESLKTSVKILLEHSDHSVREIARKLNISKSGVQRIADKVKHGQSLQSKRFNKGRVRRKTTNRDDRKIVKIALFNRKKPLKVVGNIIRESGINISNVTIRRRFYENGLRCRRPAKKQKLTPNMMKKRYEWAKKYKEYANEDWSNVMI